MGHIQQGSSGIPLNAHVLGPSEASEWHKGTGLGDLGLVLVCIREFR